MFFTGNSIIQYTDKGKYKGSIESYPEGNPLNKTSVLNSDTKVIELETYNIETGELLQTSKTEYDHGLEVRQQMVYQQIDNKSDYTISRNKQGLRIQVSGVVNYEDEEIEPVLHIVYLALDHMGNWIKSIEYLSKEDRFCVLVTRSISYYE